MQTRANALTARESASRALSSYSPAREAFPKEAHDVRIVESLWQGVRSLLWSLTLPQEPTARLREPLGSDTRTNVLLKFRLGNGAGLAAGAPPAGETVLQGPSLGPHKLPTPKIPPLQSHSGVWRALEKVTHTAVNLAGRSLKWAQGTCGTRDPEKMGWVSTWQVKRAPETDAEDNLTTQGLTP